MTTMSTDPGNIELSVLALGPSSDLAELEPLLADAGFAIQREATTTGHKAGGELITTLVASAPAIAVLLTRLKGLLHVWLDRPRNVEITALRSGESVSMNLAGVRPSQVAEVIQAILPPDRIDDGAA